MLKIEQSTIEPSFHVIFLNNFIFGLMLTVVAIVALKMRPLLEAHRQWRCHVKKQVTTLSCVAVRHFPLSWAPPPDQGDLTALKTAVGVFVDGEGVFSSLITVWSSATAKPSRSFSRPHLVLSALPLSAAEGFGPQVVSPCSPANNEVGRCTTYVSTRHFFLVRSVFLDTQVVMVDVVSSWEGQIVP